MEPSNFDKLIRQKQQQAKGLYQHERDAARASVWSSVGSRVERRKSLRWYHLAAAVILILIPIGIAFNSVQRSGKQNLQLLSSQINELKDDYKLQEALLNEKNSKLVSLQDELVKMEQQLRQIEKAALPVQRERIVYVRDTVYVRQVEYITTTADPAPVNETVVAAEHEQPEETAQLTAQVPRDDIIFFSQKRKETSQRPESLKVQIGSLASRN